ncbi:MAG TPA: Ig-like domain-containing protein [Candidatus Dormibacteraeota bacterium]|nr:Ig-like domain-containing protein [Candidatus Dormibacteraeota bacterium]
MRTPPTPLLARLCVAALTGGAALLPAASLAAKPSKTSGSADRTPPTVAISTPGGGATVGPSFTISGTASDNVAVASVSVSVDGGAAQTAAGTTSWSAPVSNLAAGGHTLTARAVDTSGNSAVASVSVTVSSNATPPTSVITEPRYDGAAISGSYTLQGGSSDSTYAVTREEWDVDGVAVATGTSPYGLSYTWDTTRVAQGGHTLTYRTWNSAGATSSASRAVTVGSATVERVAVILYNFSDQAAPTTPQTVSDWTFGTSRSVAGYYQEETFGRLLIGGHLNAAGDVFGFYTVPYAYPTAPCDFTPWEASALQQATADGFDAGQYDVVLLTAAVPAGCGSGTATANQDRVPWNDPQSADDWIAFAAHELGHSLGIHHHAGSWTCYDSAGNVVAVSGSCTSYEYGDPYDIMGSGNVSHMNGYELAQIGVLRSGNVQTVTASGTYTLAPITAPSSGVQLIRVPRAWDASGTPTDYYDIEFRQPAAYDVPPPYVVDYDGVLIREAPDFSQTGIMSHLVDTTPGSITTAGEHDNFDAALVPGRTFTDSGAGVSITTVSCGASGATVSISVAGH